MSQARRGAKLSRTWEGITCQPGALQDGGMYVVQDVSVSRMGNAECRKLWNGQVLVPRCHKVLSESTLRSFLHSSVLMHNA